MADKMNSWNGGYENIPEVVKKLEKSVNFNCEKTTSGSGNWRGVDDSRPSSGDNALGAGRPKGFGGGPVHDNRQSRSRSTKYGA